MKTTEENYDQFKGIELAKKYTCKSNKIINDGGFWEAITSRTIWKQNS